jgi:NADH-quinone oxidoreductase subunit N
MTVLNVSAALTGALPIAPEIALLMCTCIIALFDLWVTDTRRMPTFWLTQAALALTGILHWNLFAGGVTEYALNDMVVSDPLGHLLGVFASVAVMVSLAYARTYAADRDFLKGELFTLSLFSMLGVSVMLSANHFLVIYLGLELMSLSLYALVALRRDDPLAVESAMKYFVLGALASGFLLYGLSMMYGATGSLELPEVFNAIATGQINKAVLVLGLVFIVAGLAFKLGAVPFHMWVPDVYQGAPTAITLLIAGAPKLAVFAMGFRLLVEGLSGLAVDWQQMLAILAVLSMVLGNLAAMAQTNLKRLLAYSSIAQMGFMLLGFTPTVIQGNTLSAVNGYSSAMFYVVTYVFTTLGSFGLLIILSRQGFESDSLDDLKGLARRSPWLAGIMAILMFSLAGLPPTVGFQAKLSVLQAVVSTHVGAYVGLAIIAVLASLVGAYYYLRVVKLMYFDEPQDTHHITSSWGARCLLSANGVAVLVLGLLPGGLLSLCAHAVGRALST